MSYLLEALKKSERQRRLGVVPRLDTPQEPTPGPVPAPRAAWLRPLLLLNLLLVAGLLLYLLLLEPWLDRRIVGGEEERPRLAEEVQRAEPPSVAEAGEGEAAGPDEVGEDRKLGEEIAAKAGWAELGLVELEADSGESIPPPALVAVPPPVAVGPPPRWSELAASLRERINPPRLEAHVYSESPERRFVMIGGRQYRERDRLPDGLRLEEITPEGVTISWHGEPFRLAR